MSSGKGGWSSGLCGCFDDCKSCCLTFWCPCVAFGRIAEIVDQGTSDCCEIGTVHCLISFSSYFGWLLSCQYRRRMRKQYSMNTNCCADCLVSLFCGYCALCQQYRELKSRGFDMSLGWQGNLERQNREIAMASSAPMVEGGMKR